MLYYHLHRFRLFERNSSVGEEVTHLLRHATFIAIVALLASGVRTALADHALVALLFFDLANSAADVWLEPRSREALGGLPRGEYLLHFLGTFGTGLATASYLHERTALPFAPAEGLLAWQSGIAIGAERCCSSSRARSSSARGSCVDRVRTPFPPPSGRCDRARSAPFGASPRLGRRGSPELRSCTGARPARALYRAAICSKRTR